jgi:hypothetical protein
MPFAVSNSCSFIPSLVLHCPLYFVYPLFSAHFSLVVFSRYFLSPCFLPSFCFIYLPSHLYVSLIFHFLCCKFFTFLSSPRLPLPAFLFLYLPVSFLLTLLIPLSYCLPSPSPFLETFSCGSISLHGLLTGTFH